MESVLRYIGKRTLDLSYELEEFKPQIYCEPFSGSFNVGMGLRDQGYTGKLILNDLDDNVYNFWKMMRLYPSEIYKHINDLISLINSEIYDNNKRRHLSKYTKSEDKIKRAAGEYVYRAYKSIHGLDFRYKKQWKSEVEFIGNSDVMQYTRICNIEYYKALQYFDSNKTLFYIDPPYDINGVSNYYRCDSAFFDHEELREYVEKLKGHWIMTYNNSKYIQELYKDYNVNIIAKPLYGSIYEELVITNYEKPQDTIINFKCKLEDYDTVTRENVEKALEFLSKNFIDVQGENVGFDSTGL